MKSYEATTLINAGKSTVWDIITDGGNYTVWDSGITRLSGILRNGGKIRVRSRTGGNRTFRLLVRQIPGEAMTWTGGAALGLLKGVCTFTLTSYGEKSLLHVRQDLSGPLLGLLWTSLPDMEPAVARYVNAVKKRAELLSRHEARIHASPGRPGDGSGGRSDQPGDRDTPPWPRSSLSQDQRPPQAQRLQPGRSKSSRSMLDCFIGIMTSQAA